MVGSIFSGFYLKTYYEGFYDAYFELILVPNLRFECSHLRCGVEQ